MKILPAIDLRDGKVVRLERGDYDRQTTYGDDPAAIANVFADAGAEWIHIVDLDAAKSGQPTNTAAIGAIRDAVDISLELGGGMRDEQTVRSALDAGVDRVIVGSAALRDLQWFEQLVATDGLDGRIVLGLDAREGMLAADGWTTQTECTAVEIARRVTDWPLAGIVYTDIARDGMLTGVNIAATDELISVTNVPVTASGGVASLDHLLACKEIGCWGAIVGKAWYEGLIDLERACELTA
ncbi:MAG: 1-(5-phosphoribosyl)-5-[(5-phosphoribosylamino)methylideneamino]imidazole-4-carboxamide isomerase [Phycisphaerae bacterium]|jgi:phosphoribosylformimino-5-aminoimidazole carboxamide ribotide isomerase|nr:1-(5-phosphoribosyl)-5-[(5-phosphoribosylamino)methylideneamino]imidazole-4-carboxamide isomerase [Phycisphaerae bacterium]